MHRHYVFRKSFKRTAVRAFDAAGGVFARSKPETPRFGRVLIVRLDHLGDVLAATALPRMIREVRPEARISFLTASWAAPLLENNPFVEETIVYDAPWFSKRRYSGKSAGFFDTAKELADRSFDTALAPRGDLRENFLLKRAGIPARLGYGITGGGFFLTTEAEYRTGVHETQHMTDLLAASGIHASYPGPQLHFTAAEERDWLARAASLGLPPSGAYAGFQASAGTPSKEWGGGRSQRFLDAVKKTGMTVVLTGTLAEKKRVPLSRREGVIDLRGETSLRELCLLLRGCRAFLGPDSGPTHLASALGVPTVFLYSGTNRFEQWRPLAKNARVLNRIVPCAPCALETCNVDGHPCMAGLDPETAARSFAEALA